MRLTAKLPERFGQPESNAEYARQAAVLDGFVPKLIKIRAACCY
jgi:hypothetical protein